MIGVNRRRVMGGGTKYLKFEDRRVWEICCYNWGDTKEIQKGKVFAKGEIEADGSTLVVGDAVYASCLVHPKRTYSNHKVINQINAAARIFDINIQFDSATPFSSITDGTTEVIRIQQRNNGNTLSTVGTLTKNDVILGSTNELTITTSGTTDSCQYLEVAVLADSGVTAAYSISVSPTNITANLMQPVGITQAQCDVVSSIGTVFRYNSLIEDIYDIRFFASVSSLPSNAFERCSGLKDVALPNNIKTVGSNLFYGSGLTSCVIEPGGVTSLGVGMFSDCVKQVGVDIPEGVTHIGVDCFRRLSTAAGFNSLREIVYPSTITSFGQDVHLYNGLISFTIKAVNPPTLPNARMFTYGGQPTIYVPATSVELYKNAEYWSVWKNFIKAIPEE